MQYRWITWLTMILLAGIVFMLDIPRHRRCDAKAPDALASLTVTLSPTDKPDIVQAKYHNGTGQDVKIDKQVAVTSVLALEVLDALGKRIPTVPPPVPWENRREIVIPPGKDWSVDYDLYIFDPPLPPGKYRVRVGVPEWKSDELEFAIGKMK